MPGIALLPLGLPRETFGRGTLAPESRGIRRKPDTSAFRLIAAMRLDKIPLSVPRRGCPDSA